MTFRAGPEPLVVRATHHSHLLKPLFTPPMRRLLKRLSAASLATVDVVRVWPRSLETEASGHNLLGHYHSGIYRDSHLNRQSTIPENIEISFGPVTGGHEPLDPCRARRTAAGRRSLLPDHTTTSYPQIRPTGPGRTSHDASDASPTSCYFAAAIRIINKTFSTEAAAGLVPPAMCPDQASRF